MGVEKIDYSLCTGCQKCYQICPMDVFRLAGRRVYPAYPEDCMSCFLCEIECPKEAVYVNPRRARPKPLPW